MKHTLFLLTLLFTTQTFPEGFAAGTKIKTERAYVPIEHIFKGRKVICRSLRKYASRTDKVFYTYRARVSEYVSLKFANHEIKCAHDQEFYIRATKEWVTARQLVGNKYIQNLFAQQTRLLSARTVHEPINVYIFTTKKYHNFLVSCDDILVHNLEPFFATTAGLMYASLPVIGEGAGTMLASGNPYLVALGLIAAGGYFTYSWITSDSRQKEAARELQNLFDEQRQKQLEKKSKQAIATTESPDPQKDPDDKDPKDADDFFENLKKRSSKYARTNRFGKMYYDPETNLWWSKDHAMHGSSRFKVFKKTAKNFEWVFNADKYGNQILNQHKGPIGSVIPLKKVIF